MKKIFDKKGETYIDVAITVMIVAFVLVFAVNMVSIVALNQNMKTMADQIIATMKFRDATLRTGVSFEHSGESNPCNLRCINTARAEYERVGEKTYTEALDKTDGEIEIHLSGGE